MSSIFCFVFQDCITHHEASHGTVTCRARRRHFLLIYIPPSGLTRESRRWQSREGRENWCLVIDVSITWYLPRMCSSRWLALSVIVFARVPNKYDAIMTKAQGKERKKKASLAPVVQQFANELSLFPGFPDTPLAFNYISSLPSRGLLCLSNVGELDITTWVDRHYQCGAVLRETATGKRAE